MIKEINEEVSSNKRYEIYEEVQMTTPDDKTVTVLQLKETVTLDNLNGEIAQIGNEINNLQERLVKRQAVLAEINNL
jgi:hypothetical protein